MIDLSYLTEEEQEMILTVLKRDAELKKLEEQRIKQLRKTERDRGRLKYLTGEWFYETKYHRHRDRIHGSDIIRASMRQRKPVTILELSQRWSENPTCVYGEKKDVYIPPELSGLIEDLSTQSQNERVDDEAQQERQRPQIKPRQNPFNSVRSQRNEARLFNGVKEADQTPAEGRHELYVEPQSSQVSNIHSSTEVTGDSEDDGPVKAALERANARPISISKSLEDLTSTPLQERWKTDPRGDVRKSMENVSAVTPNTKTSFSDPEQVKMMSMSVPAFMQQEMDCGNSDCASVSSSQYDRLRTCNTPSNFSTCSEVASMSSVTGSVMSIYSSEFGNVEVKGTIQFAIHYVQKLGEFHIFVVQCKDLAVADVKRNRSDPYVKCYLLPDKAKYGKKKTCVRKKTLDPAYNEILRFKIPMEMLKTQKLNISVWHNDTFGRNSFLGEVEVDLAEWDFNNTQMNEYLLKGRVQVPISPKHSVGGGEMSAEIKVALRFLPQTSNSQKNKGNGEMQIWVKECKNLPISRGVAIDPFVKCAVLPDASRKNRQKTRVLKRSSNPVFNHTMVYDGFRQEDLKEACVELTVWDHDRLNNHFIGGIRLGPGTGKSYGTEVNWMDSNAAEAALWERMMQFQNEWVEDVLPLRMMVMARMSR
ncbi:synaptotagmin-like protein 2 isoform X14 [Ctenopharyngodon idella]|uniref:synaptotagmin-like protein 2 isoform X14 n=1 Tax=Ctenopharyngodon idella TaxID=7959 RepID=UPI00222E8ABF|nr:synaptotagmin-like protein 2 isoform X14 [Ctenopharyngodon idella]